MATIHTDGFVAPNGGRDTMSIVHGCLSTLVLCSWTALHPPVPANDDSEWTITLRRAKWMLASIVAPEYVAVHSVREWYEARWLSRQILAAVEDSVPKKENGPTGPQVLEGIDPKSQQQQHLEEVIVNGNKQARDTTADGAIGSRDQQNLSEPPNVQVKAVLQQVDVDEERGTVRMVEKTREPHTKQPKVDWTIVHAYFVRMGGFELAFEDRSTFRLNASQFLALLQQGYMSLPEVSANEIKARSKADVFAKLWTSIQMFWVLAYIITRAIAHLPVTSLELFTVGEVCCTLIMYIACWKKPQRVESAIKIRTKLKLEDVQVALHKEKDNERLDGLRVGSTDNIDRSRTGMKWFTYAILLPTVVFSIPHLAGWQLYFVTVAEKALWQAASINCLVLPLAIIGLSDATRRLDLQQLDYGLAALLFIYAVFRVYMFAEIFAGLRQVPAGVYVDDQWTKYIPHVGN